jgi:hypothetical protein
MQVRAQSVSGWLAGRGKHRPDSVHGMSLTWWSRLCGFIPHMNHREQTPRFHPAHE